MGLSFSLFTLPLLRGYHYADHVKSDTSNFNHSLWLCYGYGTLYLFETAIYRIVWHNIWVLFGESAAGEEQWQVNSTRQTLAETPRIWTSRSHLLADGPHVGHSGRISSTATISIPGGNHIFQIHTLIAQMITIKEFKRIAPLLLCSPSLISSSYNEIN